MPNDPHRNDFLQRFLLHNGPGPHHLTFKVPNLSEAISQARTAGFDPIGIDRTDPEWMEAFLHPKDATGVVVQMAEAPTAWTSTPPADYPTARRERSYGGGPVSPANLRRVVHAVNDLAQGASLFVGLLGAEVVDEGERSDHRWMDLQWRGPLSLRLVAPTRDRDSSPLHEWLQGRSGRIHHLELDVEEPDGVKGADPGTVGSLGLDVDKADPFWLVQPQVNYGLQLMLSPI